MVELGKRVDDSICETYLRNCDVGVDSGVTLRVMLVWFTGMNMSYSQFLRHFSHKAGHEIHVVVQMLCHSSSGFVFFGLRFGMMSRIVS